MNNFYCTAKKACKVETIQASLFAIKPIKRAKCSYFGNKKAIIEIFFVYILWFLYGAGDRSRTGTAVTPRDFKSLASTYSATSAFKIGGTTRIRTGA